MTELMTLKKRPIAHLRWYVAGFLCLASALNYLDRQSLSVLIGTIKDDLKLTNTSYGDINCWFLVSYSLMYAVSGRVIDLIGTRRGFMVFVSGWSGANMLHVLARTARQFSFFRFLLGVFEPGGFTGGVRAVSEWFPMRERALAIGIFNCGTAVGSMLAAPIVSFIAAAFGWQMAFVVTGGLGFVWVAAWTLFYRPVHAHPRLSEQERALIMGNEVEEKAGETANGKKVSVGQLLRMKETWGYIIVRMLSDPISYFLLFWMPLYFQNRHGFDLTKLGLFMWIPYAVAVLGNVMGGAAPRYLIARGWQLNTARKMTMLAATCMMPLFCVLATSVNSPAWAMAVVAGMTFCHAAWGNITLAAEVFPKQVVGTVTGLGGAMGSMVSALSQLYIGRVVDAYGFAPIFLCCAGLYPAALAVVQTMVGRLGITRAIPSRAAG